MPQQAGRRTDVYFRIGQKSRIYLFIQFLLQYYTPTIHYMREKSFHPPDNIVVAVPQNRPVNMQERKKRVRIAATALASGWRNN